MLFGVYASLILFIIKNVSTDVSELRGFNLNSAGYVYPIPPIQFDEISTPAPVYLPPPILQDDIFPPPEIPIQSGPAYLPPNLVINQPPNTLGDEDTVAIAPPSYLPPTNSYLPPQTTNNYPQMRIINMSCILDSSFKCMFRVESKAGSGFLPPVVEDGSDNCISYVGNNVFQIDLEEPTKMSQCGVRRCSVGSRVNNMCVIARIPTVRGIRLPEDSLVTFQCTPQERIVSQTRHVRIGSGTVNTGFKGRSNNGIIATGGGQKELRTKIQLLRKSPGSNNFDQFVQPDSSVQLGEELVLRAAIDDSDGWKYSLIGPVVLRSSSFKKSAMLVQENGCRNADMKSVCPFQPRQVTPLETMLHFRAFLFQEAPKGDEMILSVRMQGCIHSQDCLKNGICSDSENWTPQSRLKRNANQTTNSTDSLVEDKFITNLESQFAFRVQTDENFEFDKKFHISYNEFYVICISLSFFILSLMISLIIYKFYNNLNSKSRSV